MSDEQFLLEDAQGPKIRFEAGNVGTGTNTRIMTMPEITAGNGTTLVGADTTPVSYTHLRAHETLRYLGCRRLR